MMPFLNAGLTVAAFMHSAFAKTVSPRFSLAPGRYYLGFENILLPELSRLIQDELVSSRSSIPIARRFCLQDGEIPDLLWHYTGADGLLGIVTSGQFRATDVFFFNDSSEVHSSLRLIEKTLPDVRSQLIVDLPNNAIERGPATQVSYRALWS